MKIFKFVIIAFGMLLMHKNNALIIDIKTNFFSSVSKIEFHYWIPVFAKGGIITMVKNSLEVKELKKGENKFDFSQKEAQLFGQIIFYRGSDKPTLSTDSFILLNNHKYTISEPSNSKKPCSGKALLSYVGDDESTGLCLLVSVSDKAAAAKESKPAKDSGKKYEVTKISDGGSGGGAGGGAGSSGAS